MATRHHKNHIGLQEHSVGDIYPWSIVGKGTSGGGFAPSKTIWQPQQLVSGEQGPCFTSHAAAEQWALDAIEDDSPLSDDGKYVNGQRALARAANRRS